MEMKDYNNLFLKYIALCPYKNNFVGLTLVIRLRKMIVPHTELYLIIFHISFLNLEFIFILTTSGIYCFEFFKSFYKLSFYF